MKSIKRSGVRIVGMTNVPMRSTAISREFTDTPARRRMRGFLRVAGLLFFILTVLCVIMGGFHILAPSAWAEYETFWGVLGCVFIVSCLINHLGFFFEIAGDSGGRNWFSLGAGLIWLSLLSSFTIAGVFELAKRCF